MKKQIKLLALLLLFSLSYSQFLNFLHDDKEQTKKESESEKITASVKYNFQHGTYSVILNKYDQNAPAFGTYTKSLLDKGWDFLAISSYKGNVTKYTDDTKAYSMGYLEGYLTSERIWDHFNNMRAYHYEDTNGKMTQQVKDFLTQNYNWMKQMAISNMYSDPYWFHVYTIIRQIEGLLAGYNSVVEEKKKLSYEEFQVMNAFGDIDELKFWDKTTRTKFDVMNSEEIADYIEGSSHCSALIKVNADFSDVWFGHNTWSNFSSMIRIFKEYSFKSNRGSEKTKTVAFSGYPATISSVDDFYITDQDLYITETTNEIFKTELYDLLTPQSLLTWVRNIVANRLSADGKTWTEIFSKYNSGTYNNQFQILDLKLIDTDKKVIYDNALWIVEQIPGQTQSSDVTNVLRYGYWPSYNSPYFKDIRTNSGYDDQLKSKPELKDTIDYDGCARANIFRRDQFKVNDLEGYKKLLRYNDFKNDPLSKGNPKFAIACRSDLYKNPECRGATDAKIASIKDIKGKKDKKITIISGPTADNQEPFDSSKAACSAKAKYVFNGLPENFNFSWTEYVTTLFD